MLSNLARSTLSISHEDEDKGSQSTSATLLRYAIEDYEMCSNESFWILTALKTVNNITGLQQCKQVHDLLL